MADPLDRSAGASGFDANGDQPVLQAAEAPLGGIEVFDRRCQATQEHDGTHRPDKEHYDGSEPGDIHAVSLTGRTEPRGSAGNALGHGDDRVHPVVGLEDGVEVEEVVVVDRLTGADLGQLGRERPRDQPHA